VYFLSTLVALANKALLSNRTMNFRF